MAQIDGRYVYATDLIDLQVIKVKWMSERTDAELDPKEYVIKSLVDVDERDYRTFEDFGWYVVRLLAVQSDQYDALSQKFRGKAEVDLNSIAEHFVTGIVSTPLITELPKKGELLRVLIQNVEFALDEDGLDTVPGLHVDHIASGSLGEASLKGLRASDEDYFRRLSQARAQRRNEKKKEEAMAKLQEATKPNTEEVQSTSKQMTRYYQELDSFFRGYMKEYGERSFNSIFETISSSSKVGRLIKISKEQKIVPTSGDFVPCVMSILSFMFAKREKLL